LFWNWVTGDGYQNMADALSYADDVADYLDTALAESETLIDGVARLHASAKLATYSGGPNTITLTTGASLAAYPSRITLRFRATATNTGAVTFNVDGLGAKAGRTIGQRVALPAGFIRTDVDTLITYDGTNFVVDREPEYISTANGAGFIYGDGRAAMYKALGSLNILAIGAGTYTQPYRTTTLDWTFPKALVVVWNVVITPESTDGTALDKAVSVTMSTPTPTGVTSIGLVRTSGSTTSVSFNLAASASGMWY
jgi:hypothetical protein